MKFHYFPLLAPILFLAGCSSPPQDMPCAVQEVAHLQPFAQIPEIPADEASAETAEAPTDIRAVWIPVMQYADWMQGTAEEFRAHVRTAFADCAELGINTVFVHVRAYGDAYYNSSLFPIGQYQNGNYDALSILLDEGHALGLSVHAWINPMRTADAQRLAATDKPLGEWYRSPEKNGTWLVASGGLYYLNPAYAQVRQFIVDGVVEILTQYPVDGIHIDDFFYPTQDAAFDAQAFAESGAQELAAWRRENCNALVQELYRAVKAQDARLIFSISPQGNADTNYHKLYADAVRWCSEEGFCDWIIPQIYYGFDNAVCPFAETAQFWAEQASAATLIIGLAPYKIGQEDVWAGSGAAEWQTNAQVLSAQTAHVQELANVSGMAFYSYASLFSPDAAVQAMVQAERERIGELWDTT